MHSIHISLFGFFYEVWIIAPKIRTEYFQDLTPLFWSTCFSKDSCSKKEFSYPRVVQMILHKKVSTSFMYLQYICSVLFLSLNLEKFREKTSHLHLHFLSYISHKRVCFWGNYANIYNPADKSLNLVRCEFWCLRLFSIHGKQTTNDNDGQTFRGLFVAWWWW